MLNGFLFKGKVLRILKQEFACVPHKTQREVLAEVMHEAQRTKANPFEAAIFFMLAQMNVLAPDRTDTKIIDFIERHSKKAALLTRTETPSSEAVVDVLNGIRARHGLAPLVA